MQPINTQNYYPVAYNEAVSVPVKLEKNTTSQKIRNAKVKKLKKSIKKYVDDIKFNEVNKKLITFFKFISAVTCTLGAMGSAKNLGIVLDNAGCKFNDSHVINCSNGIEVSAVMGPTLLLGILIPITSYIAKSTLDSLSETFTTYSNDSLIEDEGFHKFVIDRCQINARSYEIESLKNMYYREQDKLNDR